MAALPEHVVALIVEMISGGPVSWEDAVTDGGLRIIRFHAFEEQRILATVDRTARRMVLLATRVLLGIRRTLSTSSSGAEAEEAHGKGVADGLRRGCMQWGCGDCYCWLRVLHCHIVPSCSLFFSVGRLCFVWSWLWVCLFDSWAASFLFVFFFVRLFGNGGILGWFWTTGAVTRLGDFGGLAEFKVPRQFQLIRAELS